MFYAIGPENLTRHPAIIGSMHGLRWRVFEGRLGWPVEVINGLEVDQFDRTEGYHLVRMNADGEADACARMLATSGPCLLGDVFPDLVTGEVPCSPRIWEATRFCAERGRAPRDVMGRLIAAILELGLALGAAEVVSVSDVRLEPLMKRAGWTPTRLGPVRDVGDGPAVAERFVVSRAALAEVRRRGGFGTQIGNMAEVRPEAAAA